MDTNRPTNDTDFMKDKSVERITFLGLFLSYFNLNIARGIKYNRI